MNQIEKDQLRVKLFKGGLKDHNQITQIIESMEKPQPLPIPQKAIITVAEAQEQIDEASLKLAEAEQISNELKSKTYDEYIEAQIEKNRQALYRKAFESVLKESASLGLASKLSVQFEYAAKSYEGKNFVCLLKIERVDGKYSSKICHYPLPSESPDQINPEGAQRFTQIMAQEVNKKL